MTLYTGPPGSVRLSISANASKRHSTGGTASAAGAWGTLRATVTCARKGLRSGLKPAAAVSFLSLAESSGTAEGFEIRTETRGRGFVLEPRRELRRARRHRLAALSGGLRSLGLAGAERTQDLRSRPVRQVIETQQQRLPARGKYLRDPARDPVELRDAPLRHSAEERQRHVQARRRHRTAAAGSDALAGGRVKRAALLSIRPQREEQPPCRLARGAQTASVRGVACTRTGRSSRRMSRSACCTAWRRTAARSPPKSFCSVVMSIERA